ncbi:hypothetical protein CK203_010525 [Vitis vinifera]|uniref:Uncharacterized protein n=1 Tax=Vitis vinifera TaxID=29760 RepID=A0A438JTL2_VITVI|nr:hypothetical protein CK203_010525 [Vitis vinifera]
MGANSCSTSVDHKGHFVVYIADLFMEYILPLIQQGVAKDMEKALLFSIAACHCSESSSHQENISENISQRSLSISTEENCFGTRSFSSRWQLSSATSLPFYELLGTDHAVQLSSQMKNTSGRNVGKERRLTSPSDEIFFRFGLVGCKTMCCMNKEGPSQSGCIWLCSLRESRMSIAPEYTQSYVPIGLMTLILSAKLETDDRYCGK